MSSETLIFDSRGDIVLILNRRSEGSLKSSNPSTTEDAATGSDGLSLTPVNMLVSSKHMSLASSVFAAMLKPGLIEGSTLESNGRVEISLPDDEPDMFAILLFIIHGRTRKVPRQVSLDQLTKLSILVDKYQMQEAAGAFAEIWIEGFNVEDVNPEDLTDVLCWLCISWVFDNAEIFEIATEYLMRKGDSEFDKDVIDELPIPEVITRTTLKWLMSQYGLTCSRENTI